MRQNIHIDDSLTSRLVEADDAHVDADADPSAKSDAGNNPPKARFGRRRTHNEQLIVCCCGVVAARATMFGAEAVTGVVVR